MPENRQIRLARRPQGEVKPDDWEHVSEALRAGQEAIRPAPTTPET